MLCSILRDIFLHITWGRMVSVGPNYVLTILNYYILKYIFYQTWILAYLYNVLPYLETYNH